MHELATWTLLVRTHCFTMVVVTQKKQNMSVCVIPCDKGEVLLLCATLPFGNRSYVYHNIRGDLYRNVLMFESS